MKKSISNGIKAMVLATTFGTGIFLGQAIAAQPHMAAALDALRTARAELQAALPNKGGHRENAIGLVDRAIDETRMGMDAGR